MAWLKQCLRACLPSLAHTFAHDTNTTKEENMKKLKELLKSTDGTSIVEYALLCALIAVAGLSALSQISVDLNSSFDRLSQAIEGN